MSILLNKMNLVTQKQAVIDVIALVQRRFQLDPETLLFHNQLAAKSCPGTSIDRAALLQELRSHVLSIEAAPAGQRGAGARALPLPDDAFADHALIQRTLLLIEPDAPTAASLLAAGCHYLRDAKAPDFGPVAEARKALGV